MPFSHPCWALSPSFFLPSGLRRAKKLSDFVFNYSSFCFVEAVGVHVLDTLLAWRGPRCPGQGARRAGPCQSQQVPRWEQPSFGKTFLLSYTALLLAVTNKFNNS